MTALGRLAGAAIWLGLSTVPARAQDVEADTAEAPPSRPAIMFNRWEEDWSVLANPDVPREPLDDLKYAPLFADDPQTYLSLGVNLRERFEGVDAPSFGIGGAHPEDYLLSRLEADADLRLKGQVQVFVQLAAGLTGYVNFIHVKPSLALHPVKSLTVLLAAAGLWRETTADAVYEQPDIPLAGTAGRGSPFTAVYGEIRADWSLSEHVAAALEEDHYVVGETIRAAGGRDADYLGMELRYGW